MNKNIPSIYVADLGDYNTGILTGGWIQIHQGMGSDELQEEINLILENGVSTDSPHEEWAIHDYNNLPLSSEYPDLSKVLKTAEYVYTYGYDVVKSYINCFGEDTIDNLPDRFYGQFDCENDFVEELYQCEISKVPEPLINYIDNERIINDLECSGQFHICRDTFTKVLIFSCW